MMTVSRWPHGHSFSCCWLWIRFSEPPSQGEQVVDGVFDSWYVIGRLGGFNAENLQVRAGSDLSWMTYDIDGAESAMPASDAQHGAARIPERLGTLLG